VALTIGSDFPDLDGATEWLNKKMSPEELRHGPIIVQFWAVSCPLCKRNLPKLQQFLETYRKDKLSLVSVHMPRMEADMDVERVKMAIAEMELTGPCAIDNTHALGDRFQTGGVWPCYFLFDAKCKLRSRASGALGIKMAENSLKRLLELEIKDEPSRLYAH
jgi:thiol-disulfide isomerase/thioredoxin